MSSAAQAIERLRAERDDILERSRDAGFSEGQQYVLDAAYTTVPKLVSLHQFYKGCKPSEPWSAVARLLGDHAEPYRDLIREEGLDADQFALGFLEGVVETWNEIKAEVEVGR